jgi:DNA-directed RNA polymerase specialized sigma24 family protein
MASNPGNGNSIEWMLHDSQIDDATLAEALAAEYYPGLHAFVLALNRKSYLPSPNPVIEAIAKAVSDRHRFWNDTTLKAWLYRLAYQINTRKQSLLPNFRWLPRFWEPKQDEKNFPTVDLKSLDPEQHLPLLLIYGHGLDEEEAAYIFDLPVSKVRSRLNRAQRHLYTAAYPDSLEVHAKYLEMLQPGGGVLQSIEAQLELDKHLSGCTGCQKYRDQLPVLERSWKDEYKPVSLPLDQIHNAQEEIHALIANRTHNRNLLLLPLKEVSIVLVVLLALVYLGRQQGAFEAYDARPTFTLVPSSTAIPTITPFPTRTPAPRPVELAGIEGGDYFYFDTWTTEGDTWESIAAKAGLRVELVRYLNPSIPDSFINSTRIMLVGLRSSGLFQTAHVPSPSLLLEPLTAGSPAMEVLERARQSYHHWGSLWMDQLFISHGPPGYSGPPLNAYQIEVFASQPNQWISLQKELQYGASYTTYGIGDWLFGPKAGPGRLSGTWTPGGFQGAASPFIENRLRPEYAYQNVGEGEIAGRLAILLDAFSDGARQQRLWVDALTGVLLKQEMYGGPDEDIIVYSWTARTVRYDIPFPPDLFYPASSALNEYLEGRKLADDPASRASEEILSLRAAPTEKIPPPPGFDISTSPLLMQFPDRPGWEEGIPDPDKPLILFEFPAESNETGKATLTGKIQIYSGDYHLGEIELESPIFSDCQRSADGLLVALLTSRDRSRSELSWFDLSSLQLHTVTELAGGSGEFAFSPDSRRLAFANCRNSCGLSVLDLEKDLVEQVGPPLDWIFNIEWSPDGEQIAFMTYRWPQNPRVRVIQVSTGEEVFNGEYNSSSGKMITPGSPTESWDHPYPRFRDAIGCMLP